MELRSVRPAKPTRSNTAAMRILPLLGVVTALSILEGCQSSDTGDGATATTSAYSVTGRRDRKIVSLPAEPVVHHEAEPQTPLEVQFSVSNAADFDTEQFTWDFGDDSSTLEEAPLHRYESGGVYRPRLLYVDARGRTRSVDWTMKLNHPPVVQIEGGGILSDAMGMGVWLEATGDDRDGPFDTEALLWDFGDGTTARGSRVTHVYEEEGLYRVEVGGADREGAIAITSVEVEIVRLTHEDPDPIAAAPPEDDGDETIADAPDPAPPDFGDGDSGGTGSGSNDPLDDDSETPIADDPSDTGGDGDGESVPVDPEGPTIVDDPYAGPTESLVMEFDEPLPWIDGIVLTLVTDPSAVYSGAGALQIHGGATAFPPGALVALQDLLAPYAESPELHVNFFQRASDDVMLDTSRVREAAESLVAAGGESLDEQALAVLNALVQSLEAQPPVELLLNGGEWYCVELSARLSDLDGAPALEVTLSIRGEPVLSGWFQNVAPALALEAAVPVVLESYRQSNPSAVLTIDALRVDNAPFSGCP